ncbi:MAG: rod-binding protein [Bacillota bacterium]
MNNNLARYQMDIQKNNLDQNQIQKLKANLKNQKTEVNNIKQNNENLNALEKEAEKFTAIFLEKMFSSMKKTLPEEKMFDGGYAEDVFSDMLTKEYSQMAGKQGILGELNRALVNQLKDS